VSPADRHGRHHKRQVDLAISGAYSRLAGDPHARSAFAELLTCARMRAPSIFQAPVIDGRHLGVDALFHLARFVRSHVRSLPDWEGSVASWRTVIRDLASHLVARHQVPAFLTSAWYADDDLAAETQRGWYVAHGAGARFRSLDLPVNLTSLMEHHLLLSPEHLTIEAALRRAELLGLGAAATLVDAVLATRLAWDLSNGGFWRTFWMFLIGHDRAIAISKIGPVIEFLHSVRHMRIPVETANGVVWTDPPHPDFSLKGRTPQSLLKLLARWQRGSGAAHGGLSWRPSPLRPLVIEVPRYDPTLPPVRWQMTELTNGAQLRAEGARLHHCVGRYAYRCWRGDSRIWSLRVWRNNVVRPVVTVEVDVKKFAIIQARGYRDFPASRTSRSIIERWAWRERLRMAI